MSVSSTHLSRVPFASLLGSEYGRLSWRVILKILGGLSGSLFTAFLVKLYRHRQSWRALGLPGPPHDLIFGHLRVFGEHASAFVGMHLDYTAQSVADAYGDGLVFLDLWPFAQPICLVSDPEIADQIVRVDNLPKCLKAMTVHFPIFGEESLALAASDEKGDQHWKTVRKAIAPGFKKGHLERCWTADTVEEAEHFVQRLEARAQDGQPAIMAEYLVDTTLDLILRVTISNKDKQLSKNILKVLNAQLDHASNTGVGSALFARFNPWVRYGQWQRTRAMYDLLEPTVSEHIRSAHTTDLATKDKKDVLDWALASHPSFSISTLVDQVKTFVLAGHDTASSTLAWCYYHLSQDTAILAKIREEHTAVLGAKVGQEAEAILADPSKLNDLKYTTAVIREALRLYPPAAAVREADSNLYVVEHMGTKYSVAGCMLWVNHWCLHRSKETWGEDADTFRPERWLDDEGTLTPTPLAWMPFSKGPKNCIGMEFGYLEQKIILSMTVRKFDFAYTQEKKPFQKFRLTAQPSNGIPLNINSKTKQ